MGPTDDMDKSGRLVGGLSVLLQSAAVRFSLLHPGYLTIKAELGDDWQRAVSDAAPVD